MLRILSYLQVAEQDYRVSVDLKSMVMGLDRLEVKWRNTIARLVLRMRCL